MLLAGSIHSRRPTRHCRVRQEQRCRSAQTLAGRFRPLSTTRRLGDEISRDPIGELGGLNLYGFCGNAGDNVMDFLGLVGCGEAPGKRYRFSIPPPTGGWKGVVELKDSNGTWQAQAIGLIETRWKAEVTVVCNCPCGTRRGTRVLFYKDSGTWLVYNPNSHPGRPVVPALYKGIGKLVAAGIKEVLGNNFIVAPQSSITEMTKTINSHPAPTMPWDGRWEGGVSPCDK